MAAYIAKVNLLFKMGRYADAEPILRAALTENPDDALAHAMFGVALSRTERIVAGLGETETAIGLDPTNSYAFYAHGLVLISAKRPGEAMAAVKEAITLDPQAADYFHILAALLFDEMQLNGCLAATDQCLALDPRHAGCLVVRGRALERLGRKDEAEQALAAALATAPEDSESHFVRGVMLLGGTEVVAAMEHLLEARRLDPIEDGRSIPIALAIGRQMAPFRWFNSKAVRWYLWPRKATWAMFVMLLFVYLLISEFHPTRPRLSLERLDRDSWRLFAFGAVTANALLLPFSLDELAALTAALIKPRVVGTTRRQLLRQAGGLAKAILYQGAATYCAQSPLLMIFPYAVGACLGLTEPLGAPRSRSAPRRRTDTVCVVYAGLLVLLAFAIAFALIVNPKISFACATVFALLSFFCDNLLRFVQRRDL